MTAKRLAAAALVFGMGVGAAAVAVAQRAAFSDVPAGHDRAVQIAAAAERGYFAGYGDGTFKPDREITSGQLATVVGRIYPDGITRADAAAFAVAGADAVAQPAAGLTVEQRLANIELRLRALELSGGGTGGGTSRLGCSYYAFGSPVFAPYFFGNDFDWSAQNKITGIANDVNRELREISTAISCLAR